MPRSRRENEWAVATGWANEARGWYRLPFYEWLSSFHKLELSGYVVRGALR